MRAMAPTPAEVRREEDREVSDESDRMVRLGSYGGMVRPLLFLKDDDIHYDHEEDEDGNEDSAAAAAAAAVEETMLLWGIQQPTLSKPNAFVSQSSLRLPLDSCGHSLSILQSPSSLVP